MTTDLGITYRRGVGGVWLVDQGDLNIGYVVKVENGRWRGSSRTHSSTRMLLETYPTRNLAASALAEEAEYLQGVRDAIERRT